MKPEEEKLLGEIKKVLKESALEDIKKSYKAGSVIGSFILCSCLIDTLAGFRYGQNGHLKLGKVFRAFVEEYLKEYDKVALYYDLRCQLVHNYSEGGSYHFIHGKNELHLHKADEKRVYINLENLINDLELSLDKLIFDMENDPDILQNAVRRYHKYGIVNTKDC